VDDSSNDARRDVIARTARDADAQGVVTEFLNFIDALPTGSTGALLFGTPDNPVATVLIEDDRICWAQVPGRTRRLNEFLFKHTGAALDRAALRTLFDEMRASAQPFGQTLVERGIVNADTLRTALLEHVAESIHAIAELAPPTYTWMPHRSRGYKPQFTFNTGEVLAAFGSFALAARASPIRRVLANLASDDACGLGFSRPMDVSTPLPVAWHGRVPYTASRIGRLGQWALGLVDVSAVFDDTEQRIVMAHDGQKTMLVWRQNAEVFFVLCPHDGVGAQRVLSRRIRRPSEELPTGRFRVPPV